ncbi:MAG: ABC transporter permease, partial [Opitutales bacterium]
KLREESRTFRLRVVTPLSPKVPEDEESDWTPQFPGLSEAESCGEWDTGIPIKHKVRDKDEEYWDTYRGSPKAFVTLAAGQEMWSTRWGSLTGLRVAKADASLEKINEILRTELSAAEAGLLFRPLRLDASDAAESPIDFGQLFLGFSFFVIVAAMALTGMLFAFAMEQRNRQAGLLLAVGIPCKKVRRLFLAEGLLLSMVGAGAGAILAIFYGKTILSLLTGEWGGAVSGATFDFAANPVSVAGGALGAVAMALLAMWWSTRRHLRAEPRELLAMGETLAATAPQVDKVEDGNGKISVGIAIGPITISWTGVSIGTFVFGGTKCSATILFLAAVGMAFATDLAGLGASMLFFVAGWCLLAAGLLFFRARLVKAAGESGALPDAATLSRRNAARRSGRSLVTAGAMAAGAFLVVGTGAFRKDASSISGEPSSGTGGFALIGETALPVYDDLNGKEGRELFDLNASLLAGSTIAPLRVREGDDASCLNLNKALRPRLYGVKPSEFAGRFSFTEGNWSTLKQSPSDGAIPAVVDQNTMMWALKKGVGDLVEYRDGEGRSFQVRLAAVAKGSMLQGALYVDEKHFEQKFPKQGGYRGFLVDIPADKVKAVSGHLADRLANYGMELRPAADRLAELQEVENTYIAIFQVLGGLGLLLGTAGLAVVVVRNLLERSKEFGLLEAVGYPLSSLRQLAMTEHLGLALWGLGIGSVSAMLGITPVLFGEMGQK